MFFFNVLRRKTVEWIQTNQYEEIELHYEKGIFFCVFELVTYKKRENGCKALYIGKQKDITRNLYNECFIVSQEPQGKKRKNSCTWRSFIDTKRLKLMNNTLIEKRTTLPNACILGVFHILCYENPKFQAKLALCEKKKKRHYQKSAFGYFWAC